MPFMTYFRRFLSGLSSALKSPEAQIVEKALKVSPQAQIAIIGVEIADSVFNAPASPETTPSSSVETRS